MISKPPLKLTHFGRDHQWDMITDDHSLGPDSSVELIRGFSIPWVVWSRSSELTVLGWGNTRNRLPSRKLTWPFGSLIYPRNMLIFRSYVSLPESNVKPRLKSWLFN